MSKRYMERREFNAIIAGLRALQENLVGWDEILDDGLDSSADRIDDAGIDQLIEDIQFDAIQLRISE